TVLSDLTFLTPFPSSSLGQAFHPFDILLVFLSRLPILLTTSCHGPPTAIVFDDFFVGDCIAHASYGHKQRLTPFSVQRRHGKMPTSLWKLLQWLHFNSKKAMTQRSSKLDGRVNGSRADTSTPHRNNQANHIVSSSHRRTSQGHSMSVMRSTIHYKTS